MLIGPGQNYTSINRCITPVYRCDRCFAASFANKSNLHRHMRGCGVDPSYKCEYCEYQTKRKDNLKTHVGIVHRRLL